MLQKTYAPIVAFAYNRLDSFKTLINSLRMNPEAKDSELFIFVDGPRTDLEGDNEAVNYVKEFAESVSGFKSIENFFSESNKGLANSIIYGVDNIINKYGRVIVLEDDLEIHPFFLKFMNNALDLYEDNDRIQTINGFSLYLKSLKENSYIQTRPFPWGWGTWKKYWNVDIFNKVNIHKLCFESNLLKEFKRKCGDDISIMLLNAINGKNNSWYVFWVFNHFLNNTYSIYPRYSLINNIGFDTVATNCKGINVYKSQFLDKPEIIFDFRDSLTLNREFLIYFTFWHKISTRLKLITKKNGIKALSSEFIRRIINK